jgi:hypothetical protein
MTVVIVGGKGRESERDRAQVRKLIELCSEQYPLCTFATTLTTAGVGYFVKEKCLESTNGKYRYQLIDVNVRSMGANLLNTEERNGVLLTRNATLAEMGDLFYYFGTAERRGMMEDLIQRIEGKRPYKVFLPDSELELI